MNLIFQTIKIFSSKILFNFIIVVLMCFAALTISEGILGILGMKQFLREEIEFKGADNLLLVQNVNIMDSEPVDLTNLSFSPDAHFVEESVMKIVGGKKHLALTFFDDKLLSLCRFNLLEGRLPSAISDELEFIAPEGLYKLGEEIEIEQDFFKKAIVVGICSKDDRIIDLATSSSGITGSKDLFTGVYFSEMQRYRPFTIARQGVTTDKQRNALVEYDKEVYSANKTAILNELTGRGLRVSSIGEMYAEKEASIGKSISQDILVTLAFAIPALIMLIFCYHNLLSTKANTIGVYYVVGYSQKKINIMMLILSTLYNILFIPTYQVIGKIIGVGAFSIIDFAITLAVSIIFNFIGLLYILILLKKTKIVNLVRQEGE